MKATLCIVIENSVVCLHHADDISLFPKQILPIHFILISVKQKRIRLTSSTMLSRRQSGN